MPAGVQLKCQSWCRQTCGITSGCCPVHALGLPLASVDGSAVLGVCHAHGRYPVVLRVSQLQVPDSAPGSSAIARLARCMWHSRFGEVKQEFSAWGFMQKDGWGLLVWCRSTLWFWAMSTRDKSTRNSLSVVHISILCGWLSGSGQPHCD